MMLNKRRLATKNHTVGSVRLVVLVCRNVPQALPLVRLHRQPGQGLHATVDTQTITHQHIHDPLERSAQQYQ